MKLECLTRPSRRATQFYTRVNIQKLIEDQRLTYLVDPPDFWAKTTTYWDYFNLVRPNRGKEWQSPLQILQRHAPALVGAV